MVLVSQSHHESPFKYETLFTEDTATFYCGRSWIMNEERMDSLVQNIRLLEDSLTQLDFIEDADTNTKYVKLFDAEFTYRVEAWGEVSKQLCVTDTNAGEMLSDSITLNGTTVHGQQLKLYNDIFLVISREYYYLGNCRFWTTWTTYCIREDELENFMTK